MPDRIMLVEDEVIVALDLQQRLEKNGYEVIAHATSGDEAVRLAKKTEPNLILMDIKIRGAMDGIEAAAKIRESQNIPIIYITAFSDEETLKRARQTEAYGYLVKPFEDRELRAGIEIAIYKHEIEKKLRESEEQFRIVFENSSVGYSMTSLEGICLKVNQAFASMLGYTIDEITGKNWKEITQTEDIQTNQEQIESISSQTKNTLEIEKRYVRKDGISINVLINSTLLFNSKNDPLFYITNVIDITQRKLAEESIRILNLELEKRVKFRTSDLEKLNLEMAAFSYSVSHDLRTPLRAINGYSQIIIQDHSESLDADVLNYLDIIRKNSIAMGQLIDDLLAFSRLGKQDLHKVNVKPGLIVQEVLDELRYEISQRKIKIEINSLPDCEADPALLKQVFMNLISNAIKFTRAKKDPLIEIGVSRVPPPLTDLGIRKETNCYFVKDNGVGFDMKYYDKLFQVFHRLHRAEEYEGTGVGLAFVRNIVLRHNGQIWAESIPDQGATFSFCLEEEKGLGGKKMNPE